MSSAQKMTSSQPPNTAAFHREIEGYANLLKIPGLSVAVIQDGKIIYRQNEGYADVEHKIPVSDDSIFRLASVTKTFSAVVMMQYLQEGKISLDDYLTQYPFMSVGFFPQRLRADVQLKHILSQTSEGIPGTSFIYNGSRYNFIYGVFQKVGAQPQVPLAISQELNKQIITPLGMTSTSTGFSSTPDAIKARIVQPYQFDPITHSFSIDQSDAQNMTCYPATGLLSDIDDLATYTTALDRNKLISKASYAKMTSPYISNNGTSQPYGFGWFTQKYSGVQLHWAYGFGNADSSLILRVPERKLTLIMFANCTFPSDASKLEIGDVLRSPFALAFLKHFVFENANSDEINYDDSITSIQGSVLNSNRKDRPDIYDEELLTQALVRAYANHAFNTSDNKPEKLTELLYKIDPERFKTDDPVLLSLLSQTNGKALDRATQTAINAYYTSHSFQPEALLSIAKCYENRGLEPEATVVYHQLADKQGYEEQGATVDACTALGLYYEKIGDFVKARSYLWKAAVYTWQVGSDGKSISDQLDHLNQLIDKQSRHDRI